MRRELMGARTVQNRVNGRDPTGKATEDAPSAEPPDVIPFLPNGFIPESAMSRPRNPRRPAGLLLPRPSVALLLSLFLLGSALSTAPRPLDAQLAAWPGAGGSGQEEALTLERLFASPEFFGERFVRLRRIR